MLSIVTSQVVDPIAGPVCWTLHHNEVLLDVAFSQPADPVLRGLTRWQFPRSNLHAQQASHRHRRTCPMGPPFQFTFVVFRVMSQESVPGKLFIVLHTNLDTEFPPRFLRTLYAFQDLCLLLKFCIARRGIQSVLGPLAHIFLCTTLMPTFFQHCWKK
jgi:hypothetical protein